MERLIKPVRRLQGVLKAPGDRSISHRALVLGAMARGKQVIDGLADTGDVRQTIHCLRTLGCFVETMPDGRTIVLSKEFGKDVTLDAGLSRTTACLMAGLVSGLPLTCNIDGAAALKRRSIMKVIEPLSAMGARITAANGGICR
jgi:3-phosphoshikimate 1-carboxyvinyltransferase